MSSLEGRLAHLRSRASRQVRASFGELARHAIIAVLGWMDRARQRRALYELDDRMLKDIGLTRVEVDRECTKPFWLA